MNINLPLKVEKGLFGKIKNFFRKLFYKLDKKHVKDIENHTNNDIQEGKFNKSIKIHVDNSVQKKLEKNQLFHKIVKNTNLLTTLSNEQLEMFIKYGNQIIQKNDEIINMKKAEIAKFKKVS